MHSIAHIPWDVSNASACAQQFNRLFAQSFLLFHRRQRRDEPSLTPQSRMLLMHLSMSGPLTIGDIALHIDRAQSVVSETVEALEKRNLLARVRDPRDRRRTLVWLTDNAVQMLARDQEVLDTEVLARAFRRMPTEDRAKLVDLLQTLIHHAESVHPAASKENDHE